VNFQHHAGVFGMQSRQFGCFVVFAESAIIPTRSEHRQVLRELIDCFMPFCDEPIPLETITHFSLCVPFVSKQKGLNVGLEDRPSMVSCLPDKQPAKPINQLLAH
jgi:hypothetical protein